MLTVVLYQPDKTSLVFPYCFPAGSQAPSPDIHSLPTTVFNYFLFTDTKRMKKQHDFNAPDAEKKIGRRIYILDNLSDDREDPNSVRAGRVRELDMGSKAYLK